MLNKLRGEHDELLRLMDMVAPALRSTRLPEAGLIGGARWNFVRIMVIHMTFKHDCCYARALAGADAIARTRLESMLATSRLIDREYREHVRAWNVVQILDRWSEYRVAAQLQQARARAQIKAERDHLYPLLASRRAAA